MSSSALTSSDLRELADKLDGRDKEAAETELQARVDRMEAALSRGGLSEEQQKILDRAQALLDALDEEDAEAAKTEGSSEREGKTGGSSNGDASSEEEPPAKKPKTREGRKSGAAYDWTVDDDGKVVGLDVARVWNEADEDDEVELA